MLEGKVALVTGAGRGLGRDYALALANAGAKVVVNDFGGRLDGMSLDEDPAGQVVEEITASGGLAVADRHRVADYRTGSSEPFTDGCSRQQFWSDNAFISLWPSVLRLKRF